MPGESAGDDDAWLNSGSGGVTAGVRCGGVKKLARRLASIDCSAACLGACALALTDYLFASSELVAGLLVRGRKSFDPIERPGITD